MLMLRQTSRHVVRPLRTGLYARHASTHSKQQTTVFPAPKPFQPFQEKADPKTGRSRLSFSSVFLSAIVIVIGMEVAVFAFEASTTPKDLSVRDLKAQKDVAARYDETADKFDSDIGMSEYMMGINGRRRDMSKKCKGHVLEVSCGTGRNVGYYDISPTSSVDSLTFIDLSKQMVAVCKQKWLALNGPTAGKARKPNMPIRFLTGSALGEMPVAPEEKKYDTILQTMGLCSTASPQELLQNMAKHLNMANPDARILLLEHGRSGSAWMDNVLDNNAVKHAEKHGCWFNRDIGAIVTAAAENSGLEIVEERRQNFGTTWEFELKPKIAHAVPPADAAPAQNVEPPVKVDEEVGGSYGWRGLLGWTK
jgi:methyltransferase OMS1